jgi:hypothetical protein
VGRAESEIATLEVIDVGPPAFGDGPADAPVSRRGRPWRTLAGCAAVGVIAAGTTVVMRHERDQARSEARARIAVAERAAFRAREALTRRADPTVLATDYEYVGHFAGVRGGRITLVLIRTKPPRPLTLAVVTITGEPAAVAVGFDFGPCKGGSGFAFSPAHPGSGDPEAIDNFPPVDTGDDAVIHVWEYAPPKLKSDAAPPVRIGGVRGPFGSARRVESC